MYLLYKIRYLIRIVNTYKISDPLTSVTIRMDGSMLACGTSRGQVLLYDIRMNKQLHKYWAETKSIQTLSFQKHMLSSESVDAETLGNKTSNSSLDVGSQSTLASSKLSSSLDDDDNNNNITSNVLSAFKSNKYQPSSSNLFTSSLSSPFDYNFSKNKKPSKYTNTLSNEGTFNNNSMSKPVENKSTNNTSKDKGKGNSVLTFTEFLKNSFSKAKTSTAATLNDSISSTTPLHNDPIYQPSTSINSASPVPSSSKSKTKTTPKLTVITMKEDLKKKSKEDIDSMKNNVMDIDKNNTTASATITNINNTNTTSTANAFEDIWLNPEVFAVPNEDQDVTMNAETLKLSNSSTPTNIDTSSTSNILPNTINLSVESQQNEALYDHYIDENSNVLREKLQNNIKEELQKNGISVH
ncbi:hypothetical protein PIROE2DRAFT_14275, partial [Piromyces sp. E2]